MAEGFDWSAPLGTDDTRKRKKLSIPDTLPEQLGAGMIANDPRAQQRIASASTIPTESPVQGEVGDITSNIAKLAPMALSAFLGKTPAGAMTAANDTPGAFPIPNLSSDMTLSKAYPGSFMPDIAMRGGVANVPSIVPDATPNIGGSNLSGVAQPNTFMPASPNSEIAASMNDDRLFSMNQKLGSGSSFAEGLKKPIIGNLTAGDVMTIAGTLAHAISPNSIGGRMGAGLVSMAGKAKSAEAQQVKNQIAIMKLENQFQNAFRNQQLREYSLSLREKGIDSKAEALQNKTEDESARRFSLSEYNDLKDKDPEAARGMMNAAIEYGYDPSKSTESKVETAKGVAEARESVKKPKITPNVNKETGNFLMSDGSDSGVKAGTKPKAEGTGKAATTQKTMYNEDTGETKIVAVKKGEDFAPPKGWTFNKPKYISPEQRDAMKKASEALSKPKAGFGDSLKEMWNRIW